MGSCYSRKARDGKCSYSDVQMASTKVEETSRLARPTPYTRNLVNSFSLKKTVAPHPIYEPSPAPYNANEQNDKFQKSTSSSTFQSNIPRIGGNTIPAAGSTESSQSSLDSNCNKNEDVELHIVNNNAMSVTTNASDAALINPSRVPKKAAEPRLEKNSAGTENSYSKISSTGKTDEKIIPSRIPAKYSAHIIGLPRPQVPQYVGKAAGARALPHLNSDNQSTPKLHPHSSEKLISEKKSVSANEIVVDFLDEQDPTQSPPHTTSGGDSQDSMTDIDSGLGNSLVEKGKQEDADTLKDVEYLESCEDSPINHVTPGRNESPLVVKATYGLKNLKLDDKTCLRSPMYRREPNGKWIVDDKHIGSLQKQLKSETGHELQSGLQLYLNSSPSIPRYKTDGYDAFSSYASYKGLLSYKRQTNIKQLDSSSPSRVKFEKGYQSDSSGIPKVKKTTSKDGSNSKVPRSMLNFGGSDRSVVHSTAVRKTSYKIDLPSDSKQSSPDSDEKSDSIGNGIASPVSELENREFLIDDEIADQPGLISFENSKMGNCAPSLQQSVTELHALQQAASSTKKRSDSQGSYNSRIFRDRSNTEGRDSLIIGSDMCSSCSSIGSDDLMLDYEKTCDSFPDGTINEGPASPVKQRVVDGDSVAEDKVLPLRRERKSITDSEERTRKWLYRRSSGPFYGGSSGNSFGKADWRLRSVSLPLRPPRQMIVTEGEDGSIKLDPSSYRLLCQDLNGVKTLLLRLKTVIQEAETLNPFDQSNPKNIFYHNLAHSDFPSGTVFHTEENNQEMESSSAIILLQENIDMRRQLVLLQQQLEEKDHTIHLLQQQMTKYTNFHDPDCGNICTNNSATQTDRIKSLSGSSSSADDSSETLVSVQDAFEEHFSKTFKEQDKFRNEMEKVTKSLSNLNQNLRVTMKKYPYLQNRSVSSSELSCYQKNS